MASEPPYAATVSPPGRSHLFKAFKANCSARGERDVLNVTGRVHVALDTVHVMII